MKATLILDGTTANGGTPLVTHNERLADPLDEYARAILDQIERIRSRLPDNEPPLTEDRAGVRHGNGEAAAARVALVAQLRKTADMLEKEIAG